MSVRPVVVLALTPVAERTIEPLLFGAETPLELRAGVAEADELERETTEHPADAVLLSPALSGITAAHCARIRAQGTRLVGLALDQREYDALTALGVDTIVSPDQSGDVLAALHDTSDTTPTSHDAAPATGMLPTGRHGTSGSSVLAVVGSKGAPGSSECAASLAALANERWPCLLVELDALGGSLDVRLGADPQQGSLLGLLRASDAGDSALRELLERWIAVAPGWPPVLLGPPDLPKALPELARPGAVAQALNALRPLYPLVVCDVGFTLGDRHFELTATARVHREALVSADAVLLVCGAREQQLRAGLAQLDLIRDELDIPAERLRVAVDGAGQPGAGRLAALDATLAERLADRGLALDAQLPWDGRGLARSTHRSGPLAVTHHRSGYARAATGLLDELFLPVSPTPRGRKRRLVPPKPEQQEVTLPWAS